MTSLLRNVLTAAGAAGVVACVIVGRAAALPPTHIIPLGEGGDARSKGYLSACSLRTTDTAKFRCYTRRLLADIERSGDPADELPRIDRRARRARGFLGENCHLLMHVVGRTYARRHHVTLATLQRYVPRSNDPGCSGGFGMGLVMYLGPRILRLGPQGAARACLGLPTRFRRYTCVHGLGHAYRRVYSGHLGGGELKFALRACRDLGRRLSPDCAQGAFHDYWISLRGADGTKRPRHPQTARSLCGRQTGLWVRACWFRYFLENPPGAPVTTATRIHQLCRGLDGLQRGGCVSAASLVVSPDPFEQMRMCRALSAADADDCVRAVAVVAVTGRPSAQRRLIDQCGTMPKDARPGCYAWFGRTLSIVTNGAFRPACQAFTLRGRREACTAGARRLNAALVTFA